MAKIMTVALILALTSLCVARQASLEELVGEDRRQEPLQRVQFLKTHKTGSTTLQGVLFRRAVYHQLPVLVSAAHYMQLPERLLLQQPHRDKLPATSFMLQHINPKTILNYDHQRLRAAFEAAVPGGRFVTVLRDPFRRTASDLVYYHHPSERSAVLKVSDLRGVDESLNEGHWRRPAHELRLLNVAAKEAIAAIDDVDVLLLESIDESLVLRHFAWGWPLEELIYIKTNSCNGQRWDGKWVPCLEMTPGADLDALFAKIRPHVERDLLIYKRALEHHQAAIALVEPSLWQATLSRFRAMNQQVESICKEFPQVKGIRVKASILQIRGGGTPTLNQIAQNPEQYCPLFGMIHPQEVRRFLV